MQAPLRLMCRFLTRTSPFAASLLFLPDTKPITNTSRGGRRARHPKTHYPTVFLFSSRWDAGRITSWRTKLADQPASSRRNSLCLNSCPCRCCLPGFVGFERFVFPTLAATPHTCICACLCACTSTCTCTCAGGTCELAKSRHARTAVPLYMSRRQRSAPKANISPSVRLGLTSIVAGNEAGIRTMLSAAASDDLVEKLVELHVERGLPSE